MKRILLVAITAILAVGLFAQSPYKGTPWKGTPWEFKADNTHNFGPEGRVILWKYDVGPAINPAPEETGNQPSDGGDFSVEPEDNLEWVIGMRDGRWRVREDDETRRLDSAAALGIELDPTDISLMDGDLGWSQFNWDPVLDRPRDGGIWPRFTITFEPGLYRFINRGFPNTNGNFNLVATLRDTSTMEIVWTSGSYNNVGDAGVNSVDLGVDPGTESGPLYTLLPNTGADNQHWYANTEVLELEGPYIMEIVLWGSGALGGQVSEFTWQNLPENKPTNLVLTSAGDIDGCDGSTLLTATAEGDPELAGVEVEYKFSRGGFTLQDWSTDTDVEVFWPGEYKVQARLVGYVVEESATVDVQKINCAPTAYEGTAQALPGALEFEWFDLGGDGVAYNEVSSPLVNDKSWQERNDEEFGLMGVDLDSTGVDTVSLDNTINNVLSKSQGDPADVNDGEWFIYSVDVAESADYSVNLKYNSDGTNVSKDLWIELWEDDLSAIVDSFQFPVTGTWDIFGGSENVPEGLLFQDKWWDTVYAHAVAIPQGSYKLRISPSTNNMNLDKLVFTKLDPVAPVLNVEVDQVMQTVPFTVSAGNKNVTAYMVPTGTATDAASIKTAAIISGKVWVDEEGQSGISVPTDEVTPGDYVMYGIDNIDQVSAGVDVTVLELVRPELTLTADQVLPGFPIEVTMSTDGIVRLYPTETTVEATDTVAALLVDTVVANVPKQISSAGLDLGYYVFYGTSTQSESDGIMTDSVRLRITTVIENVEENAASRIRVYPTVVNNRLFVDSDMPAVDVELYSIVGIRVKEVRDHAGGAIELSSLDQGIYIVRVTAGEDRSTFQIIKE